MSSPRKRYYKPSRNATIGLIDSRCVADRIVDKVHEARRSTDDNMRETAIVIVDYAKWGIFSAEHDISSILDALEEVGRALGFDFRAAAPDGPPRPPPSSPAVSIGLDIQTVLLAAWARVQISAEKRVSLRALAALAECHVSYLERLARENMPGGSAVALVSRVSAADAKRLMRGRKIPGF